MCRYWVTHKKHLVIKFPLFGSCDSKPGANVSSVCTSARNNLCVISVYVHTAAFLAEKHRQGARKRFGCVHASFFFGRKKC